AVLHRVHLAHPLARENLLKGSGRGIFLIRSFMDDVQLQRAPEGGMEIRMVKRDEPGGAAEGSGAHGDPRDHAAHARGRDRWLGARLMTDSRRSTTPRFRCPTIHCF